MSPDAIGRMTSQKGTLNLFDTLETIQKTFRVDRREIAFLRFILEAYDGIAVLTTIDPVLGIVSLRIPLGCMEEVETILDSLKKEIRIEDIDHA
jgi:hypothetical protein